METSGLLLVSVFCNMQRTPLIVDKDLRQLIFKAIQDIEISLRTKIIQVFSIEHDTTSHAASQVAETHLDAVISVFTMESGIVSCL